MPRIPFVSFDSSSLLPQNRPTGQVDTGILGQAGRDLARIGQASESAFQQMNAVYQHIQAGKFAVFAAQADNDITAFAAKEIESIKTAEDPTQAAQAADKRIKEYVKTYFGAQELTDEKGTVMRTNFPQWKYGQDNLNRMLVRTMGKLGEYSLAATHEANRVEIDRTRGNTIRVLEEYKRQGTEQAIQQGKALLNAVGPAFKGSESAALEADLRKDTVSNAFGNILAADPRAALDQVSRGVGVFSSQNMDDATRNRYMSAAQAKIKQDQEDAWTQEARAHTRLEWSRHEDNLVREERNDNLAGQFARRFDAGENPDELIREAHRMGPGVGGSGELTGRGMEAVVKYINTLRTTDERPNPIQYSKYLSRITGAETAAQVPKNSEIMSWEGINGTEISSLLRIGMERRDHLATKAKSDAETAENKANQERAQQLRSALAELETITHVGRENPMLETRATTLKNMVAQDLLREERAKRDPWAYWNTIRPNIERSMGSDLDREIQGLSAVLGGITTEEDYQAKKDLGFYNGKDEEARRDLAALRRYTELVDKKKSLGLKVEELKKESEYKKQLKTKQEAAQKKSAAVTAETEATRPMFQDVPITFIGP